MRSDAERDVHPRRPKRLASLGATALLGATAALVLTGCTAMARPPRQPALPAVKVGAIELHAVGLAGVDSSSWQGFGDLLARQANVALHRFALEEQIAASLQAPPGAPHLSGTLEIPTALPPGHDRLVGSLSRRDLAVARLELTAADGRPMATATARLEWDDVRLTMGEPKQRRARRAEAALADAVDRVIQLALRELSLQLQGQARAARPGPRHTLLMAGRIVESSAASVVLCIGSPGAAGIGQQLEVVRSTRSPGPKQSSQFHVRRVGTVRIDAIVDSHFARATVVSGQPRKGDVVRLSRPAPGAGPSPATTTLSLQEVIP